MVLFSGTYEHSIDEKGRLIVPRKLREAIDEEQEGSGFYVTKGLDDCLFMFTPRQWEVVGDQIREKAPIGTTDARHFHRLFFKNAEKVTVDKTGRILLPDRLRKLAGLTRDVVVLGIDDRMEIWDREKHARYDERYSEMYDSLAEGLSRTERG